MIIYKSLLSQCYDNTVSYPFSKHRSPCYCIVATLYMSLLPYRLVNVISYRLHALANLLGIITVSISYLTLSLHIEALATTVLWQ